MTRPEVTVVVPSRGRPGLGRLLDALAASPAPRERFEVVVVLDGHDAPAPPSRDDLDLRLLRQANAGPAAARNRGAAAALGAVLAFIDDDCEPAPDWVPRLAARVAAEGDAVIGGRVVNALEHNRWAQASQIVLDVFVQHSHGRGAEFVPTSNLGLPTEIFATLGGFDERFDRAAAEDRDFCDRCREAGHAIVRADEVVVRHHHDLTAAGFWRQHRNYGRGAVDYQLARRERGRRGSIAPSGFYPSLVRTARRHRELPRVALSQIAYASGVAAGLVTRAR